MVTLDGFDSKLLSIIQKNAELTTTELGEQVGLSPSAVQRRLKRLRSDGVISAYVAIVDPAKVGNPTHFVVGLEVDREHPEVLARLRTWLAEEDSVQHVFYATGATDFVLIVTAPSIHAYDALMSRLLAENPSVRRFTTNVVLGVHKRTSFIPLPGTGGA